MKMGATVEPPLPFPFTFALLLQPHILEHVEHARADVLSADVDRHAIRTGASLTATASATAATATAAATTEATKASCALCGVAAEIPLPAVEASQSGTRFGAHLHARRQVGDRDLRITATVLEVIRDRSPGRRILTVPPLVARRFRREAAVGLP